MTSPFFTSTVTPLSTLMIWALTTSVTSEEKMKSPVNSTVFFPFVPALKVTELVPLIAKLVVSPVGSETLQVES